MSTVSGTIHLTISYLSVACLSLAHGKGCQIRGRYERPNQTVRVIRALACLR
jgi:hypothetical protein